MYIDGNTPYPARRTPRCTFMPMLEIDLGNYFFSELNFGFLINRGLGGIPFYPLSKGARGSIIGRSEDIYKPLLQMGQVRYYWLERSQW